MNRRFLGIFLTVAAAGLIGIFEPDLAGPVFARIKTFESHKPDYAPSQTLHISPAASEHGGANYAGPGFWNLQGFELKRLLSTISEVNPIRIELPPSLDTPARYDFALVLPAADTQDNMRALIEQEIERQFHVVANHESRRRDVYVVRASENQPSVAAAKSVTAVVTYSSADPNLDLWSKLTPIGRIGSISISGTADEFCHVLEAGLEGGLDRPVVNETGLQGDFDFHVTGRLDKPKNDFVKRLHDQLGLIVTEEQRNIDMLVFTRTQ